MVIDWAQPKYRVEVKSLEAAAAELLKWPKGAKRDRAMALLSAAAKGNAKMANAEKAFLAAAKEARVVLGPSR